MLDPLIIHELIYGEVDWPKNMSTDVAKLAWYARENNVSMEELKGGLDSLKNRMTNTPENRMEGIPWELKIWSETAKKAIEAASKTKENLPILDTKLKGPGGKEYGAGLSFEEGNFAGVDNPGGRYWISVYQPFVDDSGGSMTGIPNAPYWSGTPASYPALEVLDWGHDRIMIDGGQNWYVDGVQSMIDELEEKHGDEIRKHDQAKAEQKRRDHEAALDRLVNNESIRAKKVYENMESVLKPKSDDQIEIEFESYIDDLAEMAVEMGEYDDFYDAREIFSNHKERIKTMIQNEFSQEGILGTVLYGWE